MGRTYCLTKRQQMDEERRQFWSGGRERANVVNEAFVQKWAEIADDGDDDNEISNTTLLNF